jgi:hypothetical protein
VQAKVCQFGLQKPALSLSKGLPILLESREMSWRRWRHHSAAFDSVPDMFCLHTQGIAAEFTGFFW